MKRKSVIVGTSLLSGLVAFPHGAFAQESPESEGAGIQEIVVTARRVEESLQQTPVAVTAINTAALEQAQVTDVTDLQRTAPSLVVATGAPSSSGFTYVSMRGQGNLQPTVSNDPAVGIYIDGVYIARPSQGLTDLNDLQRVEVLRGPQGTLFGRNTTGGALNILTNDPKNEFSAALNVGGGDYDHRQAGLVVNAPITETLAARVTYAYKGRDGYVDNPILDREIADLDSHFVRGKLRWAGDGDWSATLSGDYNKITDHGQMVGLSGVNAAVLQGILPPAAAPLAAQAAAQMTPYLQSHDNWYRNYAAGYRVPAAGSLTGLSAGAQDLFNTLPYNELEAYGSSLTVNGKFGIVDFKSITAYRYSDTTGIVDTDGTPVALLTTYAGYESKALSQEFQFFGDLGDRFNWISGAYFSREEGREFSISQNLGFAGTGLNNQNDADVTNVTTGVFAQGYYKLTDTLRATVGGRWTWDRRNTWLHNQRINGAAPDALVTTAAVRNCTVTLTGACTLAQKETFDYPAWTAGLDWQASDDLFVYVKTSAASKAGGWNTRAGALPAFEPEDTKDVEIGAKADWLDRRLRTNVAVFHAWQSDVQRNAAALVNGAVTQYLVNAGDAKVKGVELEITALPWTGMEMTASASFMDGEYDKGTFTEVQNLGTAAAPALVTVDRSGEPLPQLPEQQFNFGATQTVLVPFGELTLHADYAYIGEQFFNPVTAAAGSSAARLAIFAETNRLARTASYGLINARVGLQLDNPNLEFSLYGRNLGDKEYVTRSFADLYPQLGFAANFIGEPRTWGANVTYRFGN
jgi:iron complex outermembrane recepter protein